MRDSNQTPLDPAPRDPEPILPEGAAPESAPAPAFETLPDPRRGLNRTLIVWLGGLLAFGGGGLLLGQQELALLSAFAGIFVAAHAADVDRGWSELYYWLSWIVPALAFMSSVVVGFAIWSSELALPLRAGLVLIAAIAAGLSILSVPSVVGNAMARALFHEPQPGHVLRVTARCVVLSLALAIPGWFAAQALVEELIRTPGSLMEQAGLGGGLIGYVVFAFAGVGYLIRRNLREACERLGLRVPTGRDVLFAVGALAALWLLNTGADALQHRFFPDLWASDRRVTQTISAGLTVPRALLLGLSAGIGEEITLRGALQPRLGIVLTSAFFAALHVQYSWFGIAVIFVLGALLGMVRKQSSTTAAMLAHVAYDFIAVMEHAGH